MGFYHFYPNNDYSVPGVMRFRCHCGSESAKRVLTKRPDGRTYITEFAECVLCALMYHWPYDVPPQATLSMGGPTSNGGVVKES